MDRRRWLLIALLVAAIVAVLLYLRTTRGTRRAEPAATGGVAGGTPVDGSARGARRDPRTEPAASLSGTVRDPAGAAIAGAWVCTLSRSRDLADDDTREPRCATSDAAGAWRLDGLWPDTWRVEAGAERRRPAAWRDPGTHEDAIRLAAGEDRAGIDLVLRDGGVLSEGVVLDLTGGTIGGATVVVGGGWGGGAGCHTHSRDDGTFGCWVAPGDVWATAFADGYTAGWTQAIAPGEHVEILLTPESSLGGVVMAEGAPVAGARVEVEGAIAFTGPDGRFRFGRLSPARYQLIATIRGGYGEAGESVLVGLAQTRDDVVIELHPATALTGRVAIADPDGKPGAPAEDCTVLLHRTDGRRYGEETRPGGVVELLAVQPGNYTVQLECESLVARASYPDLVVADAPLEETWLVDGGPTIRGVVVDGGGQPVADASVRARNVGGDPRAARGGGADTTDREGRFVIAGARAGSVELSASAEGFPRPKDPTKVEVTGDADVRLTLQAGGAIAGTVVDETGAPVPGIDVHAQGPSNGGGGRTADDGTFTMTGLSTGDYHVTASRDNDSLRKPGSSDDDTQGERVAVTAGATATVQLVVEAARGKITGRVLDAAGQPVTDAFVRAERESEAAGRQRGGALRGARWAWSERPAVTDLDGHFTIEHLAPGAYSVLAYRKGGSEAHLEGVALGQDVTLTITATGSLAGTVVTGGEPPREVQLAISDATTGVSRSERFFRTAGAWSLHDLPAGSYDVTATAVEGTAAVEDVALADGQARTGVTITLRPTVTVTGRCVDATTGAPVPAMRVMIAPVEGAGGGFSFRAGDIDNVSDAAGRFTVEAVSQGRIRVIVLPKDRGASDYLRGGRMADVAAPGPVELGDIVVLKRRTARGVRAGDLGFTLAELPPDVDPAAVALTVASVRKDGPAAASGLVAGDVIVAVDGTDVRGEASWQFRPLAGVPEGTSIKLGLARGDTVEIRAGPPQ